MDDRVDPPERIERPRDEREAGVLAAEVLVRSNRRPAGGDDLRNDGVRNGGIRVASVLRHARVVHDDGGAPARERACVGGAEPASRTGDEHRAAVEADLVAHAFAFSAAAAPARRPKTTHSSSELPIMRFRPCVPPAISPQAYSPSSVVSASASMTRPPFW